MSHKTEGCAGKWIDIGTLTNPHLQLCNMCRATRQRQDDDVVQMSHAEGLTRLKRDLESMDPVHQDAAGWWFYDETWADRHGPFPDREKAEQELESYVETLDRERDGQD